MVTGQNIKFESVYKSSVSIDMIFIDLITHDFLNIKIVSWDTGIGLAVLSMASG